MRPIPVCFELGELLLEHVVRFGDAVGDKLVEPAKLIFRRRPFARQFIDPRLNFSIGLRSPLDDRLQQRLQPLGHQDPFRHMTRDQMVELFHRHRSSFARGFTDTARSGAAVIAIDPAAL
ncbi:hypothetical protein [Ancylobacter sonchi]|uniref:hypothetical protein n=1 Tax=Ancylobacter sonchi TaxID=1937790 RepID=UPI001FEB9451|nr:hypothetical protein [Ancylobacter sonchi]